MSDLPELEPCPRCHSPVAMYWGDCHRIACSGRDCEIQFRGVGGMSQQELIRRWNTRTVQLDWGDQSLVAMLRQYAALSGTTRIVGHQLGAIILAGAERIEELEAQVKRLTSCEPGIPAHIFTFGRPKQPEE